MHNPLIACGHVGLQRPEQRTGFRKILRRFEIKRTVEDVSLSAALFGALGGVAAMQLYRHKTRHLQFRIFFPLMLLLQAAAFGFAVYSGWLA